MEAWRRSVVCSALLVLLIVVSSGVWTVQADECWNAAGYGLCVKPNTCRLLCQGLGKIDGRCNGGYLWPICECMASHCA